MSEPQLERSVLEAKERDELMAIANALGANPGARAKKADLITAILKATGNPFYRRLDEMVNTALRISIRFTNMIKGHEADIGAHEAVLDAIAARDPDRAFVLMQTIIRDVMELIGDGIAGKLGIKTAWLSDQEIGAAGE